MRKKKRIAALEEALGGALEIASYWESRHSETQDAYDQLVDQLETLLREVKQ